MKLQIIISLILAFLLTQAPVFGKYFAMINTMIHETGHSLVALLTGEKSGTFPCSLILQV